MILKISWRNLKSSPFFFKPFELLMGIDLFE